MTAGLFPDVEDVFCDLLAGFGEVGKITPADFTGLLPFIRVGCIGGSDDRVTDQATIDVEVFDATITGSNLVAERIRQFLIPGPHMVGSVVLDGVRTLSRARQLPWGTPDVFRSFATYRATSRRQTV